MIQDVQTAFRRSPAIRIPADINYPDFSFQECSETGTAIPVFATRGNEAYLPGSVRSDFRLYNHDYPCIWEYALPGWPENGKSISSMQQKSRRGGIIGNIISKTEQAS